MSRGSRVRPAGVVLSSAMLAGLALSAPLFGDSTTGDQLLGRTDMFGRGAASVVPGGDSTRGALRAMPATRDDSAKVRKALRRAIETFQDQWRSDWQDAEMNRHGVLNLETIRGYPVRANGKRYPDDPVWVGDRQADNRTPELQRYLSALCSVDTPTDAQIEMVKRYPTNNLALMRTPLAAGAWQVPGVSFVTPRMITGSKVNGPICPSWRPRDAALTPDEAAGMDAALPMSRRTAVKKARDLLLRELEVAHGKLPGDPWIAGQRVRFAIDQGVPLRTLRAARACMGQGAGERAWCASLVGLAFEQIGDGIAADSAFRIADSLATATPKSEAGAPPDCLDSDVRLLINEGDLATLARLSCGEQQATIARMWWLADPLWSMPGNERFVAHQARRTHATLRAALDRDERYVWSRDAGGTAMRELIVRYGWPSYTYWAGFVLDEEINKVRENRVRMPIGPYTVKEYDMPRVALLPKFAAARDPFTADSTSWQLTLPPGKAAELWWPDEHMKLQGRIDRLASGQMVSFRRDSASFFALAVAAPLQELDPQATGASKAALVAATGPLDTRVVDSATIGRSDDLRLTADLAPGSVVLSAEIAARTANEPALRSRFGMQPPPTLRAMGERDVALSDPVFFHMPQGAEAPPKELPAVLSLMAGDLSFARTDAIAVYWESYGFGMSDTLQLSMRIVRNDERGATRRVLSAVGLASDLRDSITIAWTEQGSRQGVLIPTSSKSAIGRAIRVDFKSLPAGDYLVFFDVRRGAGLIATSRRAFSLREQ